MLISHGIRYARRVDGRIYVIALVAVLAAAAAVLQAALMESSLSGQMAYHAARLAGEVTAPQRYRILTDYVLAALMSVTGASFFTSALLIRIAQNVAILGLGYAYFGTFVKSATARYLGVTLLAWAMLMAYHNNGFALPTYTELALYMLAAVLIRRGHLWPILPLTVIAMLNREGAVFIPALLVAGNLRDWRRWLLAAVTMGGAAAVYFGLRYAIGPGAYSISRYGEVYPGLLLAWHNMTNPHTWLYLLPVYHVLPLAILRFRHWPAFLMRSLVLFAVPWTALIFLFGSTDETRLWLVPLAVVLIPAALSVLDTSRTP